MIEVGCFKEKTVGVFGLARSGVSSVRALTAGGARVFAWDDKETARLAAEKEGGTSAPWEEWPWHDLKAVVLSPGVPLTHPEPHPVVLRAQAAGAGRSGGMREEK